MNFIYSNISIRIFTSISLLSAFSVFFLCFSPIHPLFFVFIWFVVCGFCYNEVWKETRKHLFLRVLGISFVSGGLLGLLGSIHYSHCDFIYLISVACVSDISAYLGGRVFSGPKLCPRLSPQKTWSGFLTSLLITSFYTCLQFPQWNFSLSRLILKENVWEDSFCLFCPFFVFFPTVFHVFVGLGMSFSAQAGDLLQSLAKRIVGIKDSGTFLPGHGGILDRVDSWIGIGWFVLCVKVFQAFF